MSSRATQSFPNFPSKSWWTLRRQFAKSIPSGPVTPSYLSMVLGGAENSARANILPGLRATRLIDNDDKATDRAVRWRDNDQYPSVCEEIRQEIYPPELLESIHGTEVDRARVQRWFQNQARVGEKAAQKMASFFELLVQADPATPDAVVNQSTSKSTKRTGTPGASPTRPKEPRVSRDGADTTPNGSPAASDAARLQQASLSSRPTLHIDIQIHISPSSSADQIDQIFKSMARHLNISDSANDE